METGLPPATARSLVLASPDLRVELVPAQGADVVSVLERRSGTDLLFRPPWHPRSGFSASSRAAWVAGYPGGWQLLLPNAGDACTIDGVEWGFHGEAALTAWSVEDATDSSARLRTRLSTAPLAVEREVVVERHTLRIDEWVTNEGRGPSRFLWGHHPAFGAAFLGAGGRLELPAARFEADAVDPGSLLAPGARSAWPLARAADGGTVDLSVLPSSDEPRALLGYASELAEGRARLVAPASGLAATLRWPLDAFPCVWLWQEVHASPGSPWFGRAFALAVEPHSSFPARGAAALAEAGVRLCTLAPGQTAHVRVELEVAPAS